MISNRNNSIDIFRYICALMVVVLHTSPFFDLNEYLGYFLAQIIPRVAVPFFFSISGYFYIKNYKNSTKSYIIYIKRLLKTYILWSVIYIIYNFIINPISGNLCKVLEEIIFSFFIKGSNYHLWFFPALIYATTITSILLKLKLEKLIIPLSIFCLIFSCLNTSYFELALNIPLLKKIIILDGINYFYQFTIGIAFFNIGYVMNLYANKLINIGNFKAIIIFIIASIMWCVEALIVNLLNLKKDISVGFSLYFLIISILILLIKFPFKNGTNLGNACASLANFTYYAHPLFITIAIYLFNMKTNSTLTFLFVSFVSFVIGLIIYKSKNKVVKKLIQ